MQIKHHLKNEEGETLRQLDEIKKEYAKYYKALLKTSYNIRRVASRNKSGEAIYRNHERGYQQKKRKNHCKIWSRQR